MTATQEVNEPLEMVIRQYKLPSELLARVERSARGDRRLMRDQIAILIEEALAARARRAHARARPDIEGVEDLDDQAQEAPLPW